MGLLPVANLHRAFIAALEPRVVHHSDIEKKPLALDCTHPMPPRLRAYLYNVTHPPGARTDGEHKVQLIVPGQPRGGVGTFDASGNRFVLLCGYEADLGIFVLWDADQYPIFTYSRNVQVRRDTLHTALIAGMSEQARYLRGGHVDVVVAARSDALADAVALRFKHRVARLAGNAD
jgi:hypothetical protein